MVNTAFEKMFGSDVDAVSHGNSGILSKIANKYPVVDATELTKNGTGCIIESHYKQRGVVDVRQLRESLLFKNSRRAINESTREQIERVSVFEQRNKGKSEEERKQYAKIVLRQERMENVNDVCFFWCPSAHLLSAKQFTGLFCLTAKPS